MSARALRALSHPVLLGVLVPRRGVVSHGGAELCQGELHHPAQPCFDFQALRNVLHTFDEMIHKPDSKCVGRMLLAPTTYCTNLVPVLLQGNDALSRQFAVVHLGKGFDISVLEIFWPLCFGFSVFIVSVPRMQRARLCAGVHSH